MTEKLYPTVSFRKSKEWTDTERLDALQNLTKGHGHGWVLRVSSTGRGMRLHETGRTGAQPNVRNAIDAYLNLTNYKP